MGCKEDDSKETTNLNQGYGEWQPWGAGQCIQDETDERAEDNKEPDPICRHH